MARRWPTRLSKGPLPVADVELRPPDCRRARQGAPRGHRSSRPETGEHRCSPRAGRSCSTSGSRRPGGVRMAAGLSRPDHAARAADRAGKILGTFQYMAPEQLEGRPGRRAHRHLRVRRHALRDDHRKARVRGREPGQPDCLDLSSRGASATASERRSSHSRPLSLKRVIRILSSRRSRRSMAVRPRSRWHHLAWIARGASFNCAAVAAVTKPSRERHRVGGGRSCLAAASAIAIAALVMRRPADARSRAVPVRDRAAPNDTTFATFGNAQAISPDGRQVRLRCHRRRRLSRLWLRPLDSLASQPLKGTENASSPFWSPDSKSVGFFARGKLNRIDDRRRRSSNARGCAEWSRAARGAARASSCLRRTALLFCCAVPAGGGATAPVTVFDAPNTAAQRHGWPSFLPDGRHFLYVGRTAAGPATAGWTWDVYVGSIDATPATRVRQADSAAMYAPPRGISCSSMNRP